LPTDGSSSIFVHASPPTFLRTGPQMSGTSAESSDIRGFVRRNAPDRG
jgi:hypothetical protein